MTTALTVIERASVALGSSEHEKRLRALAKQSENIVAITNPAGYAELHAARMRLKNARLDITKIAKDARADAQAYAKAVIAEADRLVELTVPEEKRLEEIQREHDEKEARVKAEREAAEANRIAGIQARIAEINGIVAEMAGKPSDEIADMIEDSLHIMIDNSFGEFKPLAQAALDRSIDGLKQLHAGAVAQEKAAAEAAAKLAAERAELDRLRAEDKLRKHRESVELEERRAQLEIEQAAARKLIEEESRIAREKRAEEDRIAAELRAQQQAVDAKDRKEREAIAHRVDAEIRAKQAAQVAEQERIDAEKREIERQRTELLDGRSMLELFRTKFGRRPEFGVVLLAIDSYLKSEPVSKPTKSNRAAAQRVS